MESELIKLANRIDSLLEESNSRIGIAIVTGPDEACLVATKDGLLRLAAALIRSAGTPPSHETELKPELVVAWHNETHGLFEAVSEISITSECRVSEQANIREALLYFQSLSPQN